MIPKEDNVVGYRVWQVRGHILWSPSREYRWVPNQPAVGVLEVPKCPLCQLGGHGSGGIHAGAALTKEILGYLEYGGSRTKSVAGQVVLGGKIAEHYQGFRGEQGYPYCLYYVPWQAYPSKLLVRAAELQMQGGYATEKEIRATAAIYGCEVEPGPLELKEAVIAQLRRDIKRHVAERRERPKWNDKTHWGVPGRTMIGFCQELQNVGGALPQEGCMEIVQMFGNYDRLGAWLIIKRCLDRRMVRRRGERGSFEIVLSEDWQQIVDEFKQRNQLREEA